MSHCTENHNMDLTAWYKSQKLIILGKHYFVIPYIFWSKSEAIWDVMLSHHFLITLQYLFNIRLHIIIVSRGREPPFGLLNEDCLVERVGGQVFLLDHKVVANEHFVNLQGSYQGTKLAKAVFGILQLSPSRSSFYQTSCFLKRERTLRIQVELAWCYIFLYQKEENI